MPTKIAPSLLSADVSHLWDEGLSCRKCGADLLHLDVMDGHFVPNLTFGPKAAESLLSLGIPLDVHLMIDCLDWALPAFVEALSRHGAKGHSITIHQEATDHLHRWLGFIKQSGLRAGVALNPATDPSFLTYVLPDVDQVLVMTVNPGWGGQTFIRQTLEKIVFVRDMIVSSNLKIDLEVDGGINFETAKLVREKGATILVAGNYVFASNDRRKAIDSLRE